MGGTCNRFTPNPGDQKRYHSPFLYPVSASREHEIVFTPWYPGIAPCLKSLELRNNDGAASLSPLLRALGECLVLESLTLQGYRQFVDEDSDVPVTTLSELHRLHLFSCNSAPILASLHLPSLTHPLLIFDSDPREDILSHLQRQQCLVPEGGFKAPRSAQHRTFPILGCRLS